MCSAWIMGWRVAACEIQRADHTIAFQLQAVWIFWWTWSDAAIKRFCAFHKAGLTCTYTPICTLHSLHEPFLSPCRRQLVSSLKIRLNKFSKKTKANKSALKPVAENLIFKICVSWWHENQFPLECASPQQGLFSCQCSLSHHLVWLWYY